MTSDNDEQNVQNVFLGFKLMNEFHLQFKRTIMKLQYGSFKIIYYTTIELKKNV